MARMTKEEKRIEREVNAAFSKVAQGREINVMDIGKVMQAGEDAGKAGKDIHTAVEDAYNLFGWHKTNQS